MNENIFELLNILESNGFEAYIVGGYVRDYILDIESHDIDICTNARVVEMMDLFNEYNPTSEAYGSVKLTYKGYNVDLTTYRKELKYNGDRRNLEVEYVNNLIDDLYRRDFTCNTICMNKNGDIVDLLNAKEDIENGIIRCVGDIETKLNEDPLRILRAIRFASCLGFRIEEELYKSIKKNASKVEELSMNRIKEELTKILIHKNAIKGLDFLRRLGMLEYVGIDYNSIVNVPDVCGMYSQLELKKEFPFSKEEKNNIKCIQEILKYGKIDKDIMYEYGLYICLVAGEILGIKKEEITELEKKLEIRSIKDIEISSEEICEILSIEPSKAIGEVYSILKDKILEGTISNDNDVLKKNLEDHGKKWLDEGKHKEGFTF